MATISSSTRGHSQPETRAASRKTKRPTRLIDYETPISKRIRTQSPPDQKNPASVQRQTIGEVFKAQKLRYTADAQLSWAGGLEFMTLMTKDHLSPTDTSEAQRYIRCIETMKDDATDVYAQAVEIRDVVFMTPDGATVIEKGLFAKKAIPKGQVIGIYGGKLLPLNQLKGQDKFDYLFEFPDTPFKDWCIDGRTVGNFTRYMNHCNPKKENVSSVEFFYGDRPRVIFVASKAIPAGAQLMYDYGPEYWKNKGIEPSDNF